MSRPPGQRRARPPRPDRNKFVVELTLPQIRALDDAAAYHDTVLQDRADGNAPGYDQAAAARERAVLDRARTALLVHLPRSTP